MHPQYVADQSSCESGFDAGWTQRPVMCGATYLLHLFSGIFPQGYPQGIRSKTARNNRYFTGSIRVGKRDRRQTCQRASRALLPFPCWLSWPHVARETTQVTLKNSWSLIRFRSPVSRFIPANTAKPAQGQAFAPAPILWPVNGGGA